MTIYQHRTTGRKIEVLEGTRMPSSYIEVTNKTVPIEKKIDIVKPVIKKAKKSAKKKKSHKKEIIINTEVES